MEADVTDSVDSVRGNKQQRKVSKILPRTGVEDMARRTVESHDEAEDRSVQHDRPDSPDGNDIDWDPVNVSGREQALQEDRRKRISRALVGFAERDPNLVLEKDLRHRRKRRKKKNVGA